MKTMNKKPFFKAMLIAGLTGCVLSAPAFAQEDVERYRDELDRAQEEHMAEAEDFAARVLELARQQQANADEAFATMNNSEQALSAVEQMYGLDAGSMGAVQAGEGEPVGPVLYVLITLNMPDESIRSLVREAGPLGGTVVLRGFSGGNFLEVQQRLLEILDQEDTSGVIIDPRPFRAFGVERAPAFIVADQPIESCGGLECIPVAPPHDIVRGNMSIHAALEIMNRLP